MKSYRLNRSDLLVIDDTLKKGTSAEFIGLNKLNSRKGVYKTNGCMIGANNEDVREKLASQVFQMLGIPCADIDLVYDEETKENSCFSNYIINENEKLVSPEYGKYNEYSLKSVKNYIENYCENAKSVKGINEGNILEIRKNLAKMIYMDCIIDHYDRKEDNMELVCDKVTGKYIKPSAWYDYGVAFDPNSFQKNGVFHFLNNKEVIAQLFENYFDDVKDLHNLTKEKLTPKNISKLLEQEYCKDNLNEIQINDIESNLNKRIMQANKMYDLKKEKHNAEFDLQKNNDVNKQLVEYHPNIFQQFINKFKDKFIEVKDKMSGNNKNKLINEIKPNRINNVRESEEFIFGLKSNINSNVVIKNSKKTDEPNFYKLGR